MTIETPLLEQLLALIEPEPDEASRPPEPPIPPRIKGAPARVFSYHAYNGLSDIAIDCRQYNAVNIAVLVNGSSPSATISVEGGPEEGGLFQPLDNAAASRASVTAGDNWDVPVGTAWAKIRVASIAGTFGAYEGYTIVVTPWIAPGIESELPDPAALSDAISNPTAPQVGAAMEAFDGTDWDRWRNNQEVTVLGSAARTASVDSADLTNYNARGVVVVVDVTAVADTPSITVTIQGKSSLGSDYYTILASAAITGLGQTVLRVYPGLTAAANLVANDVVPRVWRVSVANADTDSITYSISANYVV